MASVTRDTQAEETLLLIGVMGVTGSGKSTFVQKASGKSEVVIGHTLEACTQKVTPYDFHVGGYHVVLVDTPGFNDTYKSDTEILIDLADWLEVTYRRNVRLNGIIYLHRITDVRMDGGSMRNLKMFRKLCGSDPMKNVIITSTFWGVIPENKAVAHETELKDKSDFWGDMIEYGARVERFMGDRKSALDIIMELAGKPTVVLELQQELVDEEKPIHETSAGAAVNEELQKMESKYMAGLKQLQRETAEALADKDVQVQTILGRERERMEHRLEKIRDDQELLRQERREEIRQIEAEHQSRYSHVQSQYERVYEKQKAAAEVQRTEDRQAFREQMSEMHLKNAALEARLLENSAPRSKQKAGHDDSHRRALQEQTGADGSSREGSKVLSDDMQRDDSKGTTPEKSDRRAKMLEVGSALLSIAASGAMCAVNPVAAVGVVGGVIDLINIIGRRSSNRAGRKAAEQSDTYTSPGDT